jgi:multidrug efflux pump subunit AcrA (membrane-fusion protein)
MHKTSLIYICGALLIFAGCSHGKSHAPPEVKTVVAKPVVVTVAPLELRSVQRRITVVGNLHGLERVVVSAKVMGRLDKVHVDVGDRVKPGSPLIEIEQTDFKLAVEEAQRALERELSKIGLTEIPKTKFDAEALPSMIRARLLVDQARRDFERAKNLSQKNAATSQELEQAQTKLQVEEVSLQQTMLDIRSTLAAVRYARSVLDTAQRQLDETRIVAPPADFASLAELKQQQQNVGYVVTKRMATAGERTSAAAAPLLELFIDDVLKLKATVPERYASEVRIGQTVEIGIEAYPNDVFQARIARVSPTIDSDSRTFEIEAHVLNTDHRLQHGSFAKAAVLTREADQAITVPPESLVTFAGVTKLFYLDGETVRETPVSIGIRGEGWVEVIGDLPTQAAVVTSGQSQLAAGSKVSIRQPLDGTPQLLPHAHPSQNIESISRTPQPAPGPLATEIAPAGGIEPSPVITNTAAP